MCAGRLCFDLFADKNPGVPTSEATDEARSTPPGMDGHWLCFPFSFCLNFNGMIISSGVKQAAVYSRIPYSPSISAVVR